MKLLDLITAACANPAWKSTPDGTTHCNNFVQEIAHGFGISDLDGLMARPMGDHILALIAAAKQSAMLCDWSELAAADAVEAAKSGCFVLGWSPCLEEQHGHVVVVAPEDMEDSGTFGGPVPMCASIAKYPFENRIMKVSEAYRIANKPRYFVYHNSATQ